MIEILRAADKTERFIVLEPAKKIHAFVDTEELFGGSDLHHDSEVQP